MSQEPIAVGAGPPQSPDLLADLSDEDDDREAGSMSESESDLEQNCSPSLVEQLSHSATAEKHAAPSSCSDTTGQTAVLNNGKTTILDITTSPRESQVAKSKGQPETTPAVSKRKYLPSASHQTSRANFKETKFDTNASVTDDHSSHGDDDVDEEQNLESTHTVQFCYDFELSQTSSQGSVCEKVFPVRQSPLERARRKKLKHGHSISVNTEDQVSDRDGSSPWSSIQQIQSNEVLLDEEDITKPRSSKDTVSVQRRPQLTRPKYIEKENSDSNLLSDSSVALLHGRIGKVTPGKELTQDVAECKNQYAHSSMKLLSTRNQNIYPNFSQQAIVSRTVKSDGSTSVSTIVSENELGIELISKPHKMRVEGGHGHGSGMNTKLPEQSIFPGKSHRRPAGEHKNYSLDLDRCKGAHGQIPGCPDHECAKPSFHPPISNTIVSLFQTGSGRTIQLDKSSLMAARESLGSLHAQTVDGDIEINDEFSLGEAFHKTNVQELSTMDELIGGNSKYALGSSCEAPSVCSTNNPSFALKGYKIQDTTDISPQEPSMSSLNEVSRSDVNLDSAQPSSVSSLFSTGSRKQVSISEDSLSSAQRSLGLSSNSGNASSGQSSSVPSLFSTGSGKQVEISEDSLSSAQRSPGLSSNSANASSVPSLFSTGSGKQVSISEDSLSSAQRSLWLSSNSGNVSSGQSSSVPSLFSTGSGKQVEISEDSLSSAQRALGLSSNSANASSVPSLFSTGSGKQVSISADSLSSAQRSLGLSSSSANASSVPSLFSTGSGKQVSISEDSLSSAQRSLGLSSNSGNVSSGQSSSVPSLFSTGSGKQVEISEDSLSSAQRALGLSSNSANASSVPSLFSTGSGKQMEISEDSLSSAQRVLEHATLSAESSQFESPARLEGASIHKKFSAQQPAIASNVSTPIRPRGRLPELRVKSATSSDTRRPKRPRAFVTPFKSGGSAQKLIKRSAASAPPKFSTAIGSTSKSGPPDKPTLGIADAVARCSRSSLSKVAGFIFSQQSSSEMICESAIELGTPKWLLAINSESAACVRFSPDNGQLLGVAPFPSSEGTYDLARQRLLEVDGVDEELATDIWTANHYRWIVWKLASFQRVLGSASSNLARACTLENVVFELQYRYDRELLKVERPALRKIFEKDAPVSRHIVLCVASVAKPGLGFNLVMTDGWYSIQVIVDNFLQRLIAKKKITIGTKIHICGAAMINNEEGIGPLETVTNNLLLPKDQKARLEPRLRLSQNCTFPAKWDTKLGFRPEMILYKQLKNIQPSWGTTVPGLRAIVVRHFETQYCERDANGRWINRNAQEEDLARRSYEDRVSQARDAIVAEHERSWEDLSQGSGGSSQLKTRAALMQRRRDSVSNALAEDPRMPTRREVKTKLRILLQQPGDDCFAELVMWNPPQEFGRMYPEGCYIELNAITVVRPSVANIPRTIGLNTSKETRFRPLVSMHARAGNVRMRIVQRIEDLCKVDHNNSNPFADVYGVLVFKTDYHAFLCSESGPEDIMSIRLGPKSLLLDDTIVFGALICVRDLLVQLREPSTDVLACTETHHTILVANPSKTLLDEARWQPFANAVGQFQKFLLADEAVEILKSARERAERITMGKALSTNQNHHTPVKSAEHLSTSSSSKSTGELHSHAPQARNSAVKSTILQSSVQAPAEDPKRIQRLRLQQEKQAQWREKYLSRKAAQGLAVAPTSPNRLASQKHHTPKELGSKDSTGTRNTLSGSKSLTLFARSTDLSHVMVGRKTVDIRKATQQIQNLRMGDLISFTDSHQRQIVRVKAAIPYDNVCSALEHEPLSRLFPRISSREDAQILLSQHISLSDAVYSLHFEIPNDEINMPGWATPSPNTKSRSRLQNQQSS